MSLDTRGVSDVLAFTLLFGIMLTSVGLIAVAGFDAVETMSDAEQVDSAEASMVELADQLTGIADHEAPVRAAELRASGATVAVVDGPTLTVTIANDTGVMWQDDIDLGGVEYRLGETTVTVAGGAVVRQVDEHATIVREPPVLVVDDRVRLNLLRIQPLDRSSRTASETRLQVRSYHDRSRLLVPTNRSALDDVTSITVAVDGAGPIADAYDQYFATTAAWSADGDGWRLDGIDDAIVRLSYVRVQFLA